MTLQSLETPYVDQISLDQFREPDAMLARRQDGKPLTRSHGAPLRLVLPSMYGYKNVKWVRELRFDATAAPGYWEQRGYDVDAWVGKSNGYGDAGAAIGRFTRTERAAHWLLASTFFAMLFTGLCLSVSAFEGILDRPTAKAWHLWSAIALAAGLVLLTLLGNRRALARSAREIDRFDGDDGRWLKGAPGRSSAGEPRRRRVASTPGRSSTPP